MFYYQCWHTNLRIGTKIYLVSSIVQTKTNFFQTKILSILFNYDSTNSPLCAPRVGFCTARYYLKSLTKPKKDQ